MKKWRPFFSFSSIPDPKSPYPRRPFQPFAAYHSQFNRSVTRHSDFYPDPQKAFAFPSPFSQFDTAPPRFFKSRPPFKQYSRIYCFRCHGIGHKARNCKLPLSCFSCAGVGHKSCNCPNFRQTQQFSSKGSIERLDDASMIPQPQIFKDPEERVDIMWSDPDVMRCYSSFSPFSGAAKCAYSAYSLAPLELPSAVPGDVPILEHGSHNAIPSKSEIQGQICLDLNPIPKELFEEFLIINEFEDYYSDEYEDKESLMSPVSPVATSEAKEYNREIFIYYAPWKFRWYCWMQSVDGFGRLARAHECGSDVWSLLKSASTPNQVSPLKQASPLKIVSQLKLASSPKQVKSIKPFRGLVLSSGVRRSPRLNKGLV